MALCCRWHRPHSVSRDTHSHAPSSTHRGHALSHGTHTATVMDTHTLTHSCPSRTPSWTLDRTLSIALSHGHFILTHSHAPHRTRSLPPSPLISLPLSLSHPFLHPSLSSIHPSRSLALSLTRDGSVPVPAQRPRVPLRQPVPLRPRSCF